MSGRIPLSNTTFQINSTSGSATNAPAAAANYNAALAAVDSMTTDLYNGLISVAFSTAIPLNAQSVMTPQSITTQLTFSAAGTPTGPGVSCQVRLTADGNSAHVPQFGPFAQLGSSGGWNNNAGVVNVVTFFFDGTSYWYTCYQSAVVAQIPAVSGAVANSSSIVITMTGSALNTGATAPAASAFPMTATRSGAAAPYSISSVAITDATHITLTLTGGTVQTGDIINVGYAQPSSNPIADTSGNLLASWGTSTLSASLANSYLLDYLAAQSVSVPFAVSTRKLASAATKSCKAFKLTGAAAPNTYSGAVDLGFTSTGALDTTNLALTGADASYSGVIRVVHVYNQGTAGTSFDLGDQVSQPQDASLVYDATIGAYTFQADQQSALLELNPTAAYSTLLSQDTSGNYDQYSAFTVVLPEGTAATGASAWVFGSSFNCGLKALQNSSNQQIFASYSPSGSAVITETGKTTSVWRRFSGHRYGTTHITRLPGNAAPESTGSATSTAFSEVAFGMLNSATSAQNAFSFGRSPGGGPGRIAEIVWCSTPLATGAPNVGSNTVASLKTYVESNQAAAYNAGGTIAGF